jgi:hypothetical protein
MALFVDQAAGIALATGDQWGCRAAWQSLVCDTFSAMESNEAGWALLAIMPSTVSACLDTSIARRLALGTPAEAVASPYPARSHLSRKTYWLSPGLGESGSARGIRAEIGEATE